VHGQAFLHNLLFPAIHKSRAKALTDVILSAIQAKELTLTSMGRALDSPTQESSNIQKVNRVFGNTHLLTDYIKISQTLASRLIGKKHHPLIIVDWSKYPNSNDAILRAALAADGRALTIYDERHPLKKMGNRKIQERFLDHLKKILPVDCHPIIVTDAGFHIDWFKYVMKQGWNYIGRVRGIRKYRLPDSSRFILCKNLFKYASSKAKSLGELILTRKNSFLTNFYVIKKKLKGRRAKTKLGKVKRDKDSKNYSKSYREPWLLVSSLKTRFAAKKVVKIYLRRMTIEESFRDLKSSKYGLGLEKVKTRVKSRRNVILLIAMLACLLAWLSGYIGEKMNLHYKFQSSFTKKRRVLSLFYLGCRLIHKKIRISLAALKEAIASSVEEAIL
jgi:hypothetical protein